MKNYKFWIGILISGIFVYLTFKGVELKKFLKTLSGINYLYLPLLFLLPLVAFYVRALRWRYLLGKEIKIKTRNLFSYLMIGFMANHVLPARIGEFVRAYIIGKKENVRASFAFSTIVVERIFDGMVILLLFLPTIFFYPFPEWIKKTGLLVGLFYPLVLVVLIILKVHKEWILKLVKIVLKPISPALLLKVKGILTSFIQGLGVLHKFDHLPVIIFYSFVVWTVTSLRHYIGFLCFDISLPFSACFFVFGMVFIGMMIPASPGSIGTYHYFCLQAFLLLGVEDKNLALSYAFFMHITNYLCVTSVGLLCLIKENISFRELRKTS
ncbi:flippase-like domain-containing protein [bacterium]|nr:flippase-like domain-containing protein [bacterium]